MKTINTFGVSMSPAGVARALRVDSELATWPAHAAAPAHATAPTVARKRRTAAATAAFVDGGII